MLFSYMLHTSEPERSSVSLIKFVLTALCNKLFALDDVHLLYYTYIVYIYIACMSIRIHMVGKVGGFQLYYISEEARAHLEGLSK